MYFRPLLWPTVVSIPALLVLIMLGTWQVQRLQWKTALIADYEARATAKAVVPDFQAEPIEFQRVALTGAYDHAKTIYLTGRTYEGNAGFHVVSLFRTDDGQDVLVNRGWVSEGYREPETRLQSMVEGTITIDGIIRLPQRQGQFVPDNEPDNGFWFTMKPDEVASYLKSDQAVQNLYIDIVRDPEAKLTLPIAAELKINVSNSHLNYAVTWYGIALSLIGVYLAYHHSAGRLRFRRVTQDKNES